MTFRGTENSNDNSERSEIMETNESEYIEPEQIEDRCDDYDDEEEEEKKEPYLKFERLQNDLLNILEKDAVSSVAVHSKFLCIGSHRGEVYVLDPLGNNVAINPQKSFKAHRVSVNGVSIDSLGEHVATCSDDGRVNIYSLCDGENTLTVNLDRKIRCIAIDPAYSKGGHHRRFAIGNGNMTMYQKNIFSLLKPFVLLEGGPVTSIKWSSRFIAWSWGSEVRIYDVEKDVTISKVRFDWTKYKDCQSIQESEKVQISSSIISDSEKASQHLFSTIHDKHQCQLFWKDLWTLFVGWMDQIKICQVTKSSPGEVQGGLPSFKVKILCMFDTEFICCGLSAFGSNILVLSIDKYDDTVHCFNHGSNEHLLPKLHIIEPSVASYEIIATTALRTRGFQQYSILDYHMDSLLDDMFYFIVTPKDLILAKSRDHDDHVEWLMDHEKYKQALEAATKNSRFLERHSVLEIGLKYFNYLMDQERYTEAGKLCLTILGKDHLEKWEEQVMKFARVGELRAIAPYLPRGEVSKLKEFVYEMVLYDYLKKDPQSFLGLVREWAPPPSLYNLTTIINAVVDHLLVCQPDNNYLLQALADLYSYEKKYGKALCMYLKLRDPRVFYLIQNYCLFNEIKESIEELMHLNINDAVSLFLKHKEHLPPQLIVSQLEGSRYYLFMYLDALYKEGKEMRTEFHGKVVSLYADFSPQQLMHFLRSSDSYELEEAFIDCKNRRLYPEMIYLLGRMGDTKEALRIIIDELDAISQAIQFCKEHDDRDLWDILITYSLNKPTYINELLWNIGSHVDPQILIRKIGNKTEIPNLKNSLVKIIHDYSLQVELQEGCKSIIVGDCLTLFEKLVKTQQKGVAVEENQICGVCHKTVMRFDPGNTPQQIKVFYCKHVFCDSCLPTIDAQNCVICNHPRKGSCFLEKL